jgi:hypothetical protein
MLRLWQNTNLIAKRRTLRAIYAHTQGYPYAATFDPNTSRTSGGQSGISGTLATYHPGTVMVKMANEVVKPAAAATPNAFGLLGHFVGGSLDELGSANSFVGVWRGTGSVFEVLAPAFNDTGLATAAAAEDGAVGNEVYLNSDATGLLQLKSTGITVARLMTRLSANAIIVELKV